MYYVFLTCAIVGGTVFLLQFLLALLGMGSDSLELGDVPDDVDFDVPDGDLDSHADSTLLFGVISFRTVVAALTFFGLAGIAALQADVGQAMAALIAVTAGVAAMFAVHYLMQSLYKLRQDGTLRLDRSIGETATVYVPIPPRQSGSGKVQIRFQGRLVECAAMTAEDKRLPTGAKVVVVDVIGSSTVVVEPLQEMATTGP